MFQQESKKLTPQEQMLADPSAMSNMMKGNLVQMVPQMLTMAWVNFFFSGFIVARVPFPLTQRFRGMLQRGVDLPSLDVTYVSSLSWYFLIVFGLSGVLQLLLGEATVNDTALMQQQMAMVRPSLCAHATRLTRARCRGWTPRRRTWLSATRWSRCRTSGRCRPWRPRLLSACGG